MVGLTRLCKPGSSAGPVCVSFLRPPPGRRMREGWRSKAASPLKPTVNSANPRIMVLCAIPVTRDTATPSRLGVHRHEPSPAALVQHGIEHLIAQLDACFVHHVDSLVDNT